MVSRPAGRRVTVRDIAAQTGVSIATVSRVLNGRDHVAPETRDLVRTAAERLRAGPLRPQGPARAAAGAVYLRCPHRRIGVIAGPHNWLAGQARLAGHASALADAGVLHPAELTRAGEPTTEFGYRAAGELLARPVRPTALVCFNDKTAVGALAAAAERGLRVPGDLSVTGFDDIDLAQATSPALSTVRQPLAEMGRMATFVPAVPA